MTSDELQARTDAVRALEAQFGELINRMRRHLNENAQRVSPGMLPGAYKTLRHRGWLTQINHGLTVDRSQPLTSINDPPVGTAALLAKEHPCPSRLPTPRRSRA